MKRILAVDDEQEMLEVIEEMLPDYHIDTASDFGTARKKLVTENYDLVILDIMGVRGLDLLDIAVENNYPAMMLTAHALDPSNVMQSMLRGAVSFTVKEDIPKLDKLLTELFDLLDKGESTWPHSIKRLAPLLDASFGDDWRSAYKDMGLIDF